MRTWEEAVAMATLSGRDHNMRSGEKGNVRRTRKVGKYGRNEKKSGET